MACLWRYYIIGTAYVSIVVKALVLVAQGLLFILSDHLGEVSGMVIYFLTHRLQGTYPFSIASSVSISKASFIPLQWLIE